MPRNNIQLQQSTVTPIPPTIRLISATPSATGNTSTSSITNFAIDAPDPAPPVPLIPASSHFPYPSPLAPKPDANSTPRKRLVPKKSKLTLLGLSAKDQPRDSERGKDLSDVVRRIGVGTAESSVKGRKGFEIYVDPTVDEDIDEIMVVRKKKSRAGLDGVRWGDEGTSAGARTLGEVTNVVNVNKEEREKERKDPPVVVKVKSEESKWWSIGRGRKDSKEKEKRAKSPEPRDPYRRSKTPEPFKQTQPESSRTRFNSLGANFLFSSAAPAPTPVPEPEPESPEIEIKSHMYTRSRTPTVLGASSQNPQPTQKEAQPQHHNQGSIALRAMRSMRSLARIGSWAQLRGGDENAPLKKDGEKRGRRATLKKEKGSVKEKKEKKDKQEEGEEKEGEEGKKKKKVKKKEKAKEKENEEEGKEEGKKKKKVKKKSKEEKDTQKEKEKEPAERTSTLRLSTSSFEIGSPSPVSESRSKDKEEKTKGLGRKKSILGLGLPSSMSIGRGMGVGMSIRLRSGSSASSAPSVARASSPSLAPHPNTKTNTTNTMPTPNVGAVNPAKLSVDSAYVAAAANLASSPGAGVGRDRAGSVISTSTTISSLRPVSLVSNVSGQSGGSVRGGSRLSSGSSVRWDEDCLESGRAARRREREEREKAKVASGEKEKDKKVEKRDARKRTPISDVFPIFGREKDVQREGEKERDQETPVVLVETATADGHSVTGNSDDGVLSEQGEEAETPMRRARRPLSDQLSGRERPRPLYEGEDGVLSILDAATNDLAQLVNHLDLEATPATPTDMTPLRSCSDPLSSSSRGAVDVVESPICKISKSKSKSKSKSMSTETETRTLGPHDVPSVSSLRPYAQSRRNLSLGAKTSMEVEQPKTVGRQIAPWPVLIEAVEAADGAGTSSMPPRKDKDGEKTMERERKAKENKMTPKRKGDTRPATTPGPEPEPEPVFVPLGLRPAKSRGAIAALRAQFEAAAAADSKPQHKPKSQSKSKKQREGDSPSVFFDESATGKETVRAPSLRTFGSHSSSRASRSLSILDASFGSQFSSSPSRSRSPVFRRAVSPPLSPMDIDEDEDTVPIAPSAKRILGMRGTMGGSDVSAFDIDVDGSDPDSDIPGELQDILSAGGDGDTMSYREGGEEPMEVQDDVSVPALRLDLPTFHADLIDDNNAMNINADADAMSSDEDIDNTKKSFDFTAEINKLNESGASDRHSFVEQLENAFRTPAKVDLRYAFASSLLEVPPVPKLPAHLVGESSAVNMKDPALLHASMTETETDDEGGTPRFEFSGSQIADNKEPTLLQDSDSLMSHDETHDVVMSDSDVSASPEMPRNLKPVSSSGSRPSEGQLNKAFKFGGLPKPSPVPAVPQQDIPKTLADIIPPPSHVRSLSNASSSIIDENDSLLRSIFAKASSDVPRSRPRLNSDSSVRRPVWETTQMQYRHSRNSSGISFAGFESFDEVRRGFEFSGDQSFYPPPTRHVVHRHQRDSQFSIASVSSYGKAHDYGLLDPFDYEQPSPPRSRPPSENLSITMSVTVDDTFSFIHRQPRRRLGSDASSFYFKAPVQSASRRESYISTFSSAPPVSLFNRSFASHRRNDSSSSVQSYAMHGGTGGRAILARHRRESSFDSVNSNFSAMRLGRPGIGDKMFDGVVDNSVSEHVAPVFSISVSPSESVADQNNTTNRSSTYEFDSIIDHERRFSTLEDSLFDKTAEKSSSLSDSSVFGRSDDDSQSSKGALLEPPRYRPLSVLSMNTPNSPVKEDDTMISMLGGGHVRRRSIDASPCPRIEKRKHSAVQPQGFNVTGEYRESPNKARIVEKPSIASTSSFSFEAERMIKAKHLEQQETVLIADGEDLQMSLQNIPVFSRPAPATRSRSSTCTSSSGGDTPPLSACDDFSSMDEGSQSSIDLNQINAALANATHPIPTLARHQVRARPRGHGHRRRAGFAPAARSSVYETIEEEKTPHKASSPSQKDTPTTCQPIFIVEPENTKVDPGRIWDDESGIITLRKYYALRDEAQTTVVESKRVWRDTPFSIFAVQSFVPPRHPADMKALLEQSVQNYGPLPSELRPRRVRSRTSSRPSPYPQARVVSKVIPPSPEKVQPTKNIPTPAYPPVLQQVPINTNVVFTAPSLNKSKPFSPLVADIEPKREKALGIASQDRPRLGPAVRRNALGSTKRSISTGGTKTSTDLKENVAQGTLTNSGDSLRINRPRPRGRPTPASTARPIRV